MDTHDKRFERIEKTMEFLLESDANLSARLDSLAATVERQQAEILEIARVAAGAQADVRDIAAETRDAINQMIGIAEGIAATATTFAERNTDHETRIGRLESQLPSDAA